MMMARKGPGRARRDVDIQAELKRAQAKLDAAHARWKEALRERDRLQAEVERQAAKRSLEPYIGQDVVVDSSRYGPCLAKLESLERTCGRVRAADGKRWSFPFHPSTDIHPPGTRFGRSCGFITVLSPGSADYDKAPPVTRRLGEVTQ